MEIKWIKITTNMFDNRKIKQIRHLPEGNNIILIWVMLLTIAGRCNAGGMIFLTENIPYSFETLALELDFDISVVKLAIDVLQNYGMIVCNENEFFISNWEEYQNIEGMEKIREQNRLRKQLQRQREKLLSDHNDQKSRDSHVTSHQSHATDIEKEGDIEREKELRNTELRNTLSNESVDAKRKRFVPPTVDEVSDYCEKQNYHVNAAHFVDYYTSNGWRVGKNPMKDWKAAVRTWEQKEKHERKPAAAPVNRSFLPTDF